MIPRPGHLFMNRNCGFRISDCELTINPTSEIRYSKFFHHPSKFPMAAGDCEGGKDFKLNFQYYTENITNNS